MSRGNEVQEITFHLGRCSPEEVTNVMFAAVYAQAMMTGLTAIEVAESVVAGLEAAEENDAGWEHVKRALTIANMEKLIGPQRGASRW